MKFIQCTSRVGRACLLLALGAICVVSLAPRTALAVANGTAAADGNPNLNNFVGMIGTAVGAATRVGSAVMLCGNSQGTVFLSVNHNIQGRTDWTRIYMGQTVNEGDLNDASKFYAIAAGGERTVWLGRTRMNGTLVNDGILVLKSNTTPTEAFSLQLADRAPNYIPAFSATDAGKYGRLLGYGTPGGWPIARVRTQGYIRFEVLLRTPDNDPPLPNIPATNSSETNWTSSNASGVATDPQNYIIVGDSGGPVFNGNTIYGISYRWVEGQRSGTFNVSSRNTEAAPERIRDRILDAVNDLVPGCMPVPPATPTPSPSPTPTPGSTCETLGSEGCEPTDEGDESSQEQAPAGEISEDSLLPNTLSAPTPTATLNPDPFDDVGSDPTATPMPVGQCGDLVVQSALGEACDDGNTASGDGCNSGCQPEFCGDDLVQSALGESCDDGNTSSADGCDSACQPEQVPE